MEKRRRRQKRRRKAALIEQKLALSPEMSFAAESILPTERAFIQQLHNTDTDNVLCIDKPIVMAIYRFGYYL